MPNFDKTAADGRIKTLIENSVKLGHRALLTVLGENARDQVMIIHHLVSKALGERPSILWCHKKDSDIQRQSRKRLKKVEQRLTSGKCDISEENAFDVFLLSTSVKYCSLSDTQRVLGSTYGMCVIQDFEALTPNTLCRIVETVSGGGVVVFLFPEMQSLRELFTISMDTHRKLKTHSHSKIIPLFNERFVISLGWCKSCLLVDDSLQVMSELKSLSGPVRKVDKSKTVMQESLEEELQGLRKSLEDADTPLPQLIGCCKTMDQSKAVLKMIDVITDKGGRETVAITAGRGRGKSAALGLSVAAAIHFGLNNIFVTSPSPENLNTFFEFIFKGFDALGYEEQNDYEIIQSTNAEYNEAVVRVNVFREFRQTVQYVEPEDANKLGQCELLVIDEAAAIPLPKVKALIGNYTVFMASTINGYEGTGRSLSLKLLQQLRQQATATGAVATKSIHISTETLGAARNLHELTLEESVRYGSDDPVERWMHDLLCLDASSSVYENTSCPPPQTCQLYYVNREVLFSGHKESEEFLNQVLSLLVSSHYRNSPDDLQVLADAPAHHLFVLLPPLSSTMENLPPVLAVIQLCLEGGIPKKVSDVSKSRGERPSGDLVPWALALQFLDTSMTEPLSARVVRVAAHPDYQGMGYGSRALNLLSDYFSRKHISLEDDQESKTKKVAQDKISTSTSFIVPRVTDAPLLSKLSEKMPETIDYLSVSYGLTLPLYKFWHRAGFSPLYISQVSNKVTGEHSCMMVKPIIIGDEEFEQENVWLTKHTHEFMRRFLSLMGGPFSNLHPQLALSVIQSYSSATGEEIDWNDLTSMVTGHDLQRLEKYCNNLADRHLITDLLPSIAMLYFLKKFPSVQLSPTQAVLLVGIGLQMKTIDEVTKLLDIPIETALGQFNRAMRRFLKDMMRLQEMSLAKRIMPNTNTIEDFTPVDITIEDELEEAGEVVGKQMEKEKAKEMQKLSNVNTLLKEDIRKFAIKGDEKMWQSAIDSGVPNTITIKRYGKTKSMSNDQLKKALHAARKEMGLVSEKTLNKEAKMKAREAILKRKQSLGGVTKKKGSGGGGKKKKGSGGGGTKKKGFGGMKKGGKPKSGKKR